jgi:hypothetical protein
MKTITTGTDKITLGSGAWDLGAWHRAVMVGNAMIAAGLWNGEDHLTLYDAYELHKRLFGFDHTPASALIEGQDYEIKKGNRSMTNVFTEPQAKPTVAQQNTCAVCGTALNQTSLDMCPDCLDAEYAARTAQEPTADPGASEWQQEIGWPYEPLIQQAVPLSILDTQELTIRVSQDPYSYYPVQQSGTDQYGYPLMRLSRSEMFGYQVTLDSPRATYAFGYGPTVRKAYADAHRRMRLSQYDTADLLRALAESRRSRTIILDAWNKELRESLRLSIEVNDLKAKVARLEARHEILVSAVQQLGDGNTELTNQLEALQNEKAEMRAAALGIPVSDLLAEDRRLEQASAQELTPSDSAMQSGVQNS